MHETLRLASLSVPALIGCACQSTTLILFNVLDRAIAATVTGTDSEPEMQCPVKFRVPRPSESGRPGPRATVTTGPGPGDSFFSLSVRWSSARA
jgi:hypothetical protein